MSFLIALITLGCSTQKSQLIENYNSKIINGKPFLDLGISKSIWEKRKSENRKEIVTAIILHNTKDLSAKEYIQKSIENGFLIQLLIDKTGTIYGVNKPGLFVYKSSPILDQNSIHISVEGTGDEVKANSVQLEILKNTIKKISNDFSIPLNNKDIASRSGIFTHLQAKKRFGFFINLEDAGNEGLLETALQSIGGKYYKEDEWENRSDKIWVLRKENLNSKNISKTKNEFDHGREITPAPVLELINVEKDENGKTPESFRLKYKLKQKIEPSCIVLHFTAIKSFMDSQKVLEARGLSASIMVDKDAKAYQILDELTDYPQAASGTNHKCIQIEIVGKNTDDLMNNEKQSEKIAALVKELSIKYKVPLSNYAVEDLNGVYSHTQTKKKWGGSVALVGKDFDPGEPYMEKILKMVGGKFYAEENWKERKSDNWIIVYGDFQP